MGTVSSWEAYWDRQTDYPDPPDLEQSERRVARVEHYCSRCLRPVIKPGMAYLRTFYIIDGKASVEKLCIPCLHGADEED